MNLADHFEPMPPPDNGLRRVHRSARRRVVMERLSVGAAVWMLFVIISGGLYVGAGFVDSESSVSTESAQSADSDADVGFAKLAPSSEGLPGGSSRSATLSAVTFYGALLGTVIIISLTIVGVLHAAFTREPKLVFRRRP